MPPASSDVVVPLRPKPLAVTPISAVSRPVIIEEDIIDYLVKAPLEQRWRILSRVALATCDEPAPMSVQPPPVSVQPPPVPQPPPSTDRLSTTAPPPPASQRAVAPPPSQRAMTPVPPPPARPMVVVPAPRPITAPPPSQRPQLELVDQTREALTPPPPPPSSSSQKAAAAAQKAASTPPPKAPVIAPPRPGSSAPPRPASASAAPPPPSAAPPRLAYSAPPPPNVDHAEELFQAMHELMQLGSAPEGARFCLRMAMAAVPSLAALVHLRDPKTLDLVVVHAEGPRADGLLRTRTPQTDSLVTRAARAGKPTVATYGAEPDAEKTKCARHAFFDPWSVVVVPVMRGGQLLGLLEMIDPTDGNPSNEQAQAAVAYVADRLGRFLAEHPAEPMAT